MLVGLYLLLGTLTLALGATAWGTALRRRKIRQRNRALAALERYDGSHGNVPGLLRVTRGLATPLEGTVASPIDPNEHAVWVRYVLEELVQGWVEVFSEARPSRFQLSLGEGRSVLVDASQPKLTLLTDAASRVFGRTEEGEFESLFDEETPEEIQLCGEAFAARVESERASRDSLFRVRIERIMEGESVLCSGVVGEGGDSLRLAGGATGTALSNLPERDLTEIPSPLVDALLALVGLAFIVVGLVFFRLWGHL